MKTVQIKELLSTTEHRWLKKHRLSLYTFSKITQCFSKIFSLYFQIAMFILESCVIIYEQEVLFLFRFDKYNVADHKTLIKHISPEKILKL